MLNPNLALTLAHARQRELLEQAQRAGTPTRRRGRIAERRADERRPRARSTVFRMAGRAGKDGVRA
jgi:hypothetical protein